MENLWVRTSRECSIKQKKAAASKVSDKELFKQTQATGNDSFKILEQWASSWGTQLLNIMFPYERLGDEQFDSMDCKLLSASWACFLLLVTEDLELQDN